MSNRALRMLITGVAAATALAGCSTVRTDDAVSTIGNAPPDYAAGDTLLPHEEWTVDSRSMGEVRRINVYLPPGYDESADARYPILYMPDGGTKEDFPHLTYTVDTAIREGRIRPIIVVGIENTQRRRDLTGPTSVDEDRTIAPVVGGSAAFRSFIRDELIPEVQRRVRGDGTTAIIGESLAGLFIVETFFLEPTMFDAYAAIDPSLWWNDGELFLKAAERLDAGTGDGRGLYLTAAGRKGDGNVEFVESLVDALEHHAPAGLHWTYAPMPDEQHSTIYRAAKLTILEELFGSRQEGSESGTEPGGVK